LLNGETDCLVKVVRSEHSEKYTDLLAIPFVDPDGGW